MSHTYGHRDTCRVCQSCGVHECYHVATRPGGRCWIDVRGPACAVHCTLCGCIDIEGTCICACPCCRPAKTVA